MKTRRFVLAAVGLVVVSAAGLGAVLEVRAQTYPSRPITFVVPFAAGGLSDVPGRILAAEMQPRIGQSIVVENRPGASGVTGAQSVLRAEPDGYTLLVNALADVQNLHYLSVPYDQGLRPYRHGVRRTARGARRQCQPAVQIRRGPDR
jgi:tripartite-type tricarboxylate transporter receptor subunit TctC